jgi:hypothetical protein
VMRRSRPGSSPWLFGSTGRLAVVHERPGQFGLHEVQFECGALLLADSICASASLESLCSPSGRRSQNPSSTPACRPPHAAIA